MPSKFFENSIWFRCYRDGEERVKTRLKEQHDNLLQSIVGYIDWSDNIFNSWKWYCRRIIKSEFSVLKEKKVFEDFERLEAEGLLSPGNYETLKDFFNNSEKNVKALQLIDEKVNDMYLSVKGNNSLKYSVGIQFKMPSVPLAIVRVD